MNIQYGGTLEGLHKALDAECKNSARLADELAKARDYLREKNEIVKAYHDAAGGRNPEELAYFLEAEPKEHIIDLRADGWTIKHPLACRSDLFNCRVNRAAETQVKKPKVTGRFYCSLKDG